MFNYFTEFVKMNSMFIPITGRFDLCKKDGYTTHNYLYIVIVGNVEMLTTAKTERLLQPHSLMTVTKISLLIAVV